ncbi:ankyrin repeat-containing domain protein [Massariosphaeria phaeospora]|uniref:Ankyrin repeat-containing domain protein n=1 Tax=Massariosphaeria phaeospora TaxID=100035 RepID=A0A7C8IA94_9PLEO|nr:ankyrin repeat-containing domain protein [Massariosphaeria phaeospora]
MAGATFDDDAIADILYLARVNDISELEAFLTELSTQAKRSTAELVAAAVDPESKNSALHYAAANGHLEAINLLLSYSSDKAATPAPGLINAVNDAGNTALHWAALNGHLESVKRLVQLGADATIINKAGHDAVFGAEVNDKKEVVEWFLGAVDGLDTGVGQASEASVDTTKEGGVPGLQGTDHSNPIGADGLHTGSVEDLRRQMEGVQTKDGSSQGG